MRSDNERLLDIHEAIEKIKQMKQHSKRELIY